MTVGPVLVQVGGVVRAQQADEGAGAGAGRRLLAVDARGAVVGGRQGLDHPGALVGPT